MTRDFLFRFFSWIIFPQSPENIFRVFSKFFEHSQRYFASQGTPTVSMTPVKPLKISSGSFLNFSNNSRDILQVKVHQRYQWHQWQICHQGQCHLLHVCHLYQRHRPLICHWYHWCQRHRGYILGTISDCLHLKVNLKKKNVNSTTQRCPNNIFKTFLIEDFFHLPTLSGLRWCTLSCEYLREF